MANKIAVKQIKSRIGVKPKLQATLRALGLRKINAERIHDDTPVIRGMVKKVIHLVEVREIK
ncbi:MAG TPA: 50S ribosomal protein L30 [Spirochaetota bacterium]|nr:50S ribosomal protein L30 [Spirochaetota bacterium]HPI88050.1 50S ribosomal protein L30 [Spirochaetota bacterium]HPR46465.1 50S ribosomal protein L30 [Spirochaetota bacterium]